MRSAAAFPETGESGRQILRLCYLGIDTYQHHVVFMRNDCPICRSEGFTAQSRVEVTLGSLFPVFAPG